MNSDGLSSGQAGSGSYDARGIRGDYPSGYLRKVLDSAGIPAEWQGREALLSLIGRSMGGWRPDTRATDDLAQIVLNLKRERKLSRPAAC